MITPSPTVTGLTCARFGLLAAVVNSAGLIALLAAPVGAHEYWLAPSRYAGAVHEAVEVGALAGTGFRGERKPFSSARCLRFEARTGRRLDLSKVARDGELVWARFAPSDSGGAMLAYESNFAIIELPAAQFDAYLELEGLDAPLAARRAGRAAGPGRERYRRCAKAWLAGNDAARALAVVGLPLELVPLAVPGEAPLLRLRLLFRGRPLEHALVKAWRAPLGPGGTPLDPETRDSVAVAWQGRTGARGEIAVPAAEPGEWLVSAVHMVPSPDRAAADWESSWASLSFARPVGRPEPR